MKNLSILLSALTATFAALATPITLVCKYDPTGTLKYLCESNGNYCEEVIMIDESEILIRSNKHQYQNGRYGKLNIEAWSEFKIIYFSDSTSKQFNDDGSVLYSSDTVYEINRLTGDIQMSDRYKDKDGKVLSEQEIIVMENSLRKKNPMLGSMPRERFGGKCKLANKIF